MQLAAQDDNCQWANVRLGYVKVILATPYAASPLFTTSYFAPCTAGHFNCWAIDRGIPCLNWYRMICIGDYPHAYIRNKYTNMYQCMRQMVPHIKMQSPVMFRFFCKYKLKRPRINWDKIQGLLEVQCFQRVIICTHCISWRSHYSSSGCFFFYGDGD